MKCTNNAKKKKEFYSYCIRAKTTWSCNLRDSGLTQFELKEVLPERKKERRQPRTNCISRMANKWT